MCQWISRFFSKKRSSKSFRSKGFSLFELLTVVTIMGVLSTIGTATYNDFVDDARYAKGQAFESQLRRKMLLSVDSYVAFWTFALFGSGGEILDGSAQKNNITLPPEINVSNTESQSMHADPYSLQFNGTGTGITVNGNTLIPKNKITISLWFKLNAHKNYNQLYRYIDSRILIRIANNKKLCFNIGHPPNRTDTCYSEDIELDKWYHVAGVYDGLKMQLYINGVVVDEADKVGYDLNPTNGSTMFLGRGDSIPSSVLNGYLDNVYVWGDAFKWDN